MTLTIRSHFATNYILVNAFYVFYEDEWVAVRIPLALGQFVVMCVLV